LTGVPRFLSFEMLPQHSLVVVIRVLIELGSWGRATHLLTPHSMDRRASPREDPDPPRREGSFDAPA
jgi:hypothetical protein